MEVLYEIYFKKKDNFKRNLTPFFAGGKYYHYCGDDREGFHYQ